MTVGSVRGKHRLEIPCRVAHGGRAYSEAFSVLEEIALWTLRPFIDLSVGGQVRLKPALTLIVGWPHAAQKGFRPFQSSNWRASAYIAASKMSALIYDNDRRELLTI